LVSFPTGSSDFFRVSRPAISKPTSCQTEKVWEKKEKKSSETFTARPVRGRRREHLQGRPFIESEHGGRGKHGCGSACEVVISIIICVHIRWDKKNALDLGCVQRHAISYYMNQQHAARAWHSASYTHLTKTMRARTDVSFERPNSVAPASLLFALD
jgi:hypothetical protein